MPRPSKNHAPTPRCAVFLSGRWARTLAALALLVPALCTPVAAHPVAFWLFFKAFGVVAGTAKLTQYQADRAYAKAPRSGSCDERRERLRQILPDTLRLARYARDIYDHAGGVKSLAAAETKLNDGVAYYEPQGSHYAELHLDKARNEAVIVFGGTRLTVRGDISADALSFVGIESAYYRWAASLTARIVREHAGMRVIATGHSLGGGLVIYTVLRNPGVEGVAFDPAGLSWATWLMTARADRARTSAALTIVSARNSAHVEPLTAMSLAHRTVLPGALYFAETETSGCLALHRATTLVAALEKLEANGAAGTACEGVLAALTH